MQSNGKNGHSKITMVRGNKQYDHPDQTGFRRNKSTTDQVLRIQDAVTIALNVGHKALAVFFDFEKLPKMKPCTAAELLLLQRQVREQRREEETTTEQHKTATAGEPTTSGQTAGR